MGQTAEWLDQTFRKGVAEGVYFAHEPIYGVGSPHSRRNHAIRLARTYSIFRRLEQMQFATLLDVGGAEGYHAHLARQLFGARAVTSDLSFEANRRARELFGLPGAAVDAHWLPYGDESFDVVLCCEVLEHVEDPVAVMCEVVRVARRCAVFSTEQACKLARAREIQMLLANTKLPDAELNYFLADDFATVLGEGVTHEREALITPRGAELVQLGQEASEEEIRDLVLEMTRLGSSAGTDLGILVIKAKGTAPQIERSAAGSEGLLEAILAEKVIPGRPAPPREERLDPILRAALACPVCLVALEEAEDGLRCGSCGRSFKVEHGIPRLQLVDEPAEPARTAGSRWPWLTEEGEKLRAKFTAPRPEGGRLFRYLLNIELNLLGFAQQTPAPEIDYLNSNALRRAMLKVAHGVDLPNRPAHRDPMWWDRLPPTNAAETEAMRSLGANILRLLLRASDQVHDPNARIKTLESEPRDACGALRELREEHERVTSRRLYRASAWLALRLWPLLRLLRRGLLRPPD